MRKCTSCNINKNDDEFKGTKWKTCIKCLSSSAARSRSRAKEIQKYHKEYYMKNSDKLKQERKMYVESNKEAVYTKNKDYYESHRKAISSRKLNRKLERMSTDIHFKLTENLRCRTRYALKKSSKCASTKTLIGCSVEELKQYLESKFQPGMSWDNWSPRGWHIDHIRPCSSFDLSDPDQQRQCFHYTNLQPLWWKDNLSKGSKYDY